MAEHSPKLRAMLRTALAACGLALVLSVPASAELRMNTTGGTSCKGSSGPGAAVFYFSNQFAENTSASSQYLTCHVPALYGTSTTTPFSVEIVFANSTGVATTVSCAMQSGYERPPSFSTVETVFYSVPVNANTWAVLNADSGGIPNQLPTTASGYDPYTLSCLLPPGVKLGLIATRLPGTISP